MSEIRDDRGIWKKALFWSPFFVIVGSAIGYFSQSGYDNDWFANLIKPDFMPPGWAFGLAWTTLYTMLGIALSTILNEPDSHQKSAALTYFWIQMVLNWLWSPIFFALHDMTLASVVLLIMLVIAAMAAGKFYRIRKVAGLLMVPYLCWLIFATVLNTSYERLNPGAGIDLLGQLF